MKKLLYLFSMAAIMCAPVGAFSQSTLVEKVEKKGNELVIPYSKYTLPNGLTVLIHEDHSDPLVHVDVTYHVGSAREEIGKSGFAHFFEHMMFQGSDNVADEEHFKIITEAGGTLNGTTNRDRTNYFETVPKNQLEKMLWLEADRMGFLLDAVTQQKFEVQRATVKNERGQRYDNQPYGLVNENVYRILYPYGHPYSWMTIGYVEDLNRVNVNDLKNFFLRWYGPNNAVLTIGGDVDPKQTMQLVEKYFGSIPRGPEVKNMAPSIPTMQNDKRVRMVDNYAKLPMLRMVYPVPQQFTKEEAALDCLAEILGQGNNSILYKNLVKNQKAVSATAYNSTSELAGEFTISAMPYKGGKLVDLEKEIRRSLKEFEQRGATEEEVEKFKSGIESKTIYGLESVSGKVSQLAAFYTYTGNANFLKTYLQQYLSLTPADVMNAYNKYIKDKGAVIMSVATLAEPDNIVGDEKYVVDPKIYVAPDYGYEGLTYNKAKDNFDRKIMPLASNNLSVVAPDFWQAKANQIKFIGTKLDEIPVVNLSIKLTGGRLFEQESKAGLSQIFAQMMEEDTKVRSAEDFSKELDKLGSSISFSSGTDGVYASVRSLQKNLDKTLALLEEKLLQPKFTQEAFSRIQKQFVEGYRNSLTRPANVASTVLSKLMYQNTPLAYPSSGNEQSLKNLTLADVENYYNKGLSVNNAEVVVVGDISKEEALKKLAFLNKLPKTLLTIPTVNAKPILSGTAKPDLYFVDFPGAAQTEFRIAQNNDLRYDATGTYYRSGIMNFPLGGAFNSRLNLYLREDKGWTYGARSGFGANKYVGNFSFSGGIKADATDSALNDVLRIIEDYRLKGATAAELDFTKNAKLQSEARAYETGGQKAGYLSQVLTYNLPNNFAKQQTEILRNIKLHELNQLAKQQLPESSKWLILLVGDKKYLSPETQSKYNVIYLDKEGNRI